MKIENDMPFKGKGGSNMGKQKREKTIQPKSEVQQEIVPSKFFTGNGYLTVACILFGCAIVPLLLLLPYLVLAADDFPYAVLARQASVAGGNCDDILTAALPALHRTSFRFPYPLAVLGVSITWMAAHFTPTLYAASSTFFELRVVNTYFLLFCFLFVINAIYLARWGIQHKFEEGFTLAYRQNITITLIYVSTLIFVIAFNPQTNSYTALLHYLITPARWDFSRYLAMVLMLT